MTSHINCHSYSFSHFLPHMGPLALCSPHDNMSTNDAPFIQIYHRFSEHPIKTYIHPSFAQEQAQPLKKRQEQAQLAPYGLCVLTNERPSEDFEIRGKALGQQREKKTHAAERYRIS